MQTAKANKSSLAYILSAPVIVATLGNFVDIYDMLLFSIVRIPSLRDMGLTEEEVSRVGASIMGWQMTGLLVGGFFWGILGDKKGRLSVLFGSIITYSLAQIANGFVTDPTSYKILRFIAGIGLAGELGAGITLVSEILPKHLRAFATTLIGGFGMLGAVTAYFTVSLFDWRVAYFVGGGMGLLLLILRINVLESGMFNRLKENVHIQKGNFWMLLNNRKRLLTYLKCIGIGLPIWFINSVLIAFGNEFGKAKGIADIDPGRGIMWLYVGIAIGGMASGPLTYYMKSRKKAVLLLQLLSVLACTIYLYAYVQSQAIFYGIILLIGLFNSYWGLFVTIAAEQFGTNLRVTATSTVPNLVRGGVVLWTSGYIFLKDYVSVIQAGAIIGIVAFAIGILSTLTIPETHDKDLDYVE